MTEHAKCSKCNAVLEEGIDQCIECEKVSNNATEPSKNDELKTNSILKKLNIKIDPKKFYFLSGSLAILFVILVVSIFIIINKSSSASEQITYIKDGELFSLTTHNKQTVELTDEMSYDTEYLSDYYIYKSEDNRYIFYPGRYDEESGYTYYWRDLSKDNSKVDSTTRVDSELSWNNVLLKDGSKFFYTKGSEDRLYVFDRKTGDKSKLDDEVVEFFVNDKGDYIVYSTFENDERTIYEMNLKGLTGTKTKIDSNSYISHVDINEKSILYIKEGALYLKENKKEPVRSVSNIHYLPAVYSKDTYYYVKSEPVTSKLIEVIEDDLPALDTEMSEPEYPQFPDAPAYPNESDYQVKVWVDSSYGDVQHPETNEWGYWSEVTDEQLFEAAYSEYEKEYKQWSDEYDRIEEEYYTALNNYENQVEIELLRQELEKEENAITYNKYSLYFVNKGKESLVTSDLSYDIHYSSADIPFVMYKKMEKSEKKLSTLIDELGWYEIYDYIYELNDNTYELFGDGNEMYAAYGTKEQLFDVEIEDVYSYRFDSIGNVYVIMDYDEDKQKGILMKATYKDGQLSKPVLIDEDVAMIPYNISNNNMYYFKNMKNGSGDLYLAGKLLAEDVYFFSLYENEDNNQLLYYKEYSHNTKRGTLTLLKDGKETIISDEASMFIAIDNKHIAYLYDYNNDRDRGDLMLYTGKSKPKVIDTDVSSILGSYY